MGKFKCYAFLCTAVNERYRELAVKHNLLSSAGYANGYVAIPKDHPLFGVEYSEVDIDVYCGLTFAERSEAVNTGFDKSKTEYLDGELPDGYWVFGFDTMHYGDSIETRPREWCIAETNSLKEQLEEWEV